MKVTDMIANKEKTQAENIYIATTKYLQHK